MKIEMRLLAEIRPYDKNARKIPKTAVDKVAASIREFGWRQPIVVDKDSVIVCGHCRYLAAGFLYPQQIIWDKQRAVLTRTHYWYGHEPCLYMRKKNAPWYGKPGENSTIWSSPSPKFIMGGSGEDKFDHPTQKPVELMRKPILNHLRKGELVYDPFLGSGTTVAAAELTERVCCGMEIDPKYVDVIVTRWEQLTGKRAMLDGDGRTFAQIKAERLRN